MAVHAQEEPADVEPGLPPLRRINVSGDLDDLLDHRPFFRVRLHGYDRLQVDNYVTWAEGELAAARRHSSHLMARYGRCAAELDQLRRARAQRTPELAPVTERLGAMLRVAAEEAAEIRATGVDEAERIVAEAHAEAEARLRNVESVRQAAVAAGEEVRRERSEAAGVLARARAEAADLLHQAAAERERLAHEAVARRAEEDERVRRQREEADAAATARLAAVQAEVEDLCRQRDEAQAALHRLTARIGEALQVVASAASDTPTSTAEVAVLADRREPLATSAS
jgi:chromosome segregation ATPase